MNYSSIASKQVTLKIYNFYKLMTDVREKLDKVSKYSLPANISLSWVPHQLLLVNYLRISFHVC